MYTFKTKYLNINVDTNVYIYIFFDTLYTYINTHVLICEYHLRVVEQGRCNPSFGIWLGGLRYDLRILREDIETEG